MLTSYKMTDLGRLGLSLAYIDSKLRAGKAFFRWRGCMKYICIYN